MTTEVYESVDVTDVTTTQAVSDDTIEALFGKIDELRNIAIWLNKQGKSLIKKNTKTPRRRTSSENGGVKKHKSGFAVPVQVAESLASFLNLPHAELVPRTEVTKKLTAYIKAKDLQVPNNRKNFICDEQLATIFNIPTGTETNWFEMQRFLSKLLTSVKKESKAEEADTVSDTPPAPPDAVPDTMNAPKKKIKKSA